MLIGLTCVKDFPCDDATFQNDPSLKGDLLGLKNKTWFTEVL